ncbi:MAG: sugar-binding protein [Planctomycetota bacterium]|nr:sugar-binding protein [Planctomycetota bacterium]
MSSFIWITSLFLLNPSEASELVLKRMAAEGLSPENCYLKGLSITGPGAKGRPMPYPKDGFPCDWSFDDGSLCGINEQGSGIQNMRAEGGLLKFSTLDKAAYFSWGNFVKTKMPLRFGYDRLSPQWWSRLQCVQIRMKQSLSESKWQVQVKRHYQGRLNTSPAATVRGTDWQLVTINFSKSGFPPYTGFRLLTETAGNDVEIDWIQPCVRGGRSCFRKTLELPAAVRWAKCSASASPYFTVYVNGSQACKSPSPVNESMIWNYEPDPALFRKGKNVIAFEHDLALGHSALLDGALLCEDGTYIRFDSDATWKFKQDTEGLDWAGPDFDDAGWANAKVAPYQPGQGFRRFWFNPSYKGPIMASPSDGRSQPVFGHGEKVSLKIAVARREGASHQIDYQVLDEMGDGFHAKDRLVRKGSLPLKADGKDGAAILEFAPGTLPHNRAYAIVLNLKTNGKDIEKRRYEIAVCGPVDQPVIENPKSYTDGMELRTVWETDAAAEQPKGEFLSCDGSGRERASRVIETPLGKFRQPYDRANIGGMHGANYISFKYRIREPGRPHLAIAEYPDDTVRVQEMRLVEMPPSGAKVMLGNHTAVLGLENPLTHQLRRHHVVFFPSEKEGTVTIFSEGMRGSGWMPSMAARVGRIRIRQIKNDIPMRRILDAPGPARWIGQQPEAGPRQVMQSCFASPIAGLYRTWLLASDTPNYYRNWMVTTINMIKRLRFAGENAYYFGQYMYFSSMFPNSHTERTNFEGAYGLRYGGSLRDHGVLMAKMFEENQLGLFTSLEITGFSQFHVNGTEEHIADGVQPWAQVDRNGRQHYFDNKPKSPVYPNYLMPEVLQRYRTLIGEIIGLYAKQPGWKGIVFQVNELMGPSWFIRNRDPYFCSYDDFTISLFEKETGISVPVDNRDRKRFSKRCDWLLANAKKEWTDWRCAKMTEIYEWLRDELKQARPDLQFILFAQSSFMWPQLGEQTSSLYERAREGGLDLEHFLKDKGTIVAASTAASRDAIEWLGGNASVGAGRYYSHDDERLSLVSNDGKNGIAIRYSWTEPDVRAPKDWPWQYSDAESWPYPSAEYFSDYWTNIFIRTNPSFMLHSLQDISMWMGRERSMSRFAQAYRSIPITRYRRLKGSGRDSNVWIAVGEYEGQAFGYIANPQWWETEADIIFAAGVEAMDLIENRPIEGKAWNLHLEPYAIHTFKLTELNLRDPVLSCNTEVSRKGKTLTTGLLREARKRLETNRKLLKQIEREASVTALVKSAESAIAAADFSTAWELLTSYPYTSLWTRKIVREKQGAHVPRKLVAVKRTKPITIDGDLSDWPPKPLGHLNESKQIFRASEDLAVKWNGKEDVSGDFRAQWDSKHLFLAFSITDNAIYFHPDVLHEGDSVEAYFDSELGKDLGERTYSEDDTHLKFAPLDGKKGRPRLYRKKARNRDQPVDELEVSWQQTGDGYRIEARVPWKLMRREPVKEGLMIGFDVLVNDADGPGLFKHWMIWSSHQTKCFKDPSSFGRLILGNEKGEGPPEVFIRSGHQSYHRARKLFAENKVAEAAGAVRDALTNDVWDKSSEADLRMLRDAYALGAKVTSPKDFLSMTREVLDDPFLPVNIKTSVAIARSTHLWKEDRERGESEARWLISDLPGIRDRDRASGHNILYLLEHNSKNPDLDKKFTHLAWQQTLRGAHINYIYDFMGENRFQAGKFDLALGLYLRAWSCSSDKLDTKRFRDIGERIEGCLIKLGHKDKAEAWKRWQLKKPAEREPCPIIGIGTLPEEWNTRWNALPSKIDGDGPKALFEKASRLYGIGKLQAARPLLEKVLTQAPWAWLQRNTRNMLSLYEKWGKHLPASVP